MRSWLGLRQGPADPVWDVPVRPLAGHARRQSGLVLLRLGLVAGWGNRVQEAKREERDRDGDADADERRDLHARDEGFAGGAEERLTLRGRKLGGDVPRAAKRVASCRGGRGRDSRGERLREPGSIDDDADRAQEGESERAAELEERLGHARGRT